MTDDPAALARASYRAFAQNDRLAFEALIAADFHFTSPLDNRIDRATFFRRCWPNNALIAGFEFIAVVPHGDRVFVTYEARAKTGRRFRNTEILTIRNGKIAAVEVYFGWTIPHEAPPGSFIDRV